MASWDTPVVSAPKTADYAAPVMNFPQMANQLEDLVIKGKQAAREEDKATAFRNGIPRDSNGDPDFNKISDTAARMGGIDYALPLLNLQMQRQSGQQGAGDIQSAAGIAQGGQPKAQPAPQRAPGSGPVQPSAAPAAAAQPTVMSILAAQGIPNDQLGAAAESLGRQLGVSPTDPIDTSDPQVRNVLGPAIQRFKGIGQTVAAGQPQPGAPAAQPQQQPPTAPAPAPTDQEAPDPNVQQADRYAAAQSFMRAKAAQVSSFNPKLAETYNKTADDYGAKEKQLRDLSIGSETLTPEQKNAADPSVTNFELKKEQNKNDVDRFGKQYDSISKIGDQADETLPQLALSKRLVNSPEFASGSFAPASDSFKRLAVALNLDPDKATPDQLFDKIRAGSILNQIKGMAGTGPVRVAEMKFIDQMIAGRDNSPATLRTLLEVESRLYERAQHVRDMANGYNGGHLDSGFANKVAAYKNGTAMFSPEELKDPRLIAPPVFNKPEELAAAKLPHGSPFKTADGRIKYVH